MQTLTILPNFGLLSWIAISFFALMNGFLFLWMYRNWQRSNKNENKK